jgi:ribulose 1,5-bisphosphate synthetase/thiazole synthase
VEARNQLETDYLVVGAGAMGVAFVDSLIEHADADVVMVERRHRAGGHWLDSYPFVQLHQPSAFYGVDSTVLGLDRIEADGNEAGFYERASGTEICGYYDEIMRHRLIGSGRVRFFPMCDYLGDRRFRSLLNGDVTEVTVRRRVVDATYMTTPVPAREPAPFAVADGVRCVPVGELTTVADPPAGYVIVGGGKTALDAICWLLDRGTRAADITWIRPRDAWLLNRRFFQPGEGVMETFEGIVLELEAVSECSSVEEVYERLEEHEVVVRIDRSVTPTMMKGATLSTGELAQLRQIDDVVRLGHVERIDLDEIVLEGGTVPTSPDHLHVHCATRGLSDRPPVPIFTEDTIVLQVVSRISLCMSAAVTGLVEASDRTTAEKNRLCRPNPWPQTPFDFLRAIIRGIETEVGWQEPDISAWVSASRLNLVGGLADQPDQTAVRALQSRFLAALFPALDNLGKLAAQASDAERARIFEPADA